LTNPKEKKFDDGNNAKSDKVKRVYMTLGVGLSS
jgi:hypothetical protein